MNNSRTIIRCYDKHGEFVQVEQDPDFIELVSFRDRSGNVTSMDIEQAEDVRDAIDAVSDLYKKDASR